MSPQELFPRGSSASLRSRLNAVLLQNVSHRTSGVIVSEICKGSLHTPIPPFPVLSRHPQDESLHFGQNVWPTGLSIFRAIVLLGNQPTMPCQQSVRRHDRCDLRQPFPSQSLGFGRQSTPLVIGESHATMADLLAK